MKLQATFVHSHIFIYGKDGNVYSEGKLTYETWKRYLSIFDNLNIIGRFENREDISEYNISSGQNVKHIKLKRDSIIANAINLNNSTRNILEDTIKNSDIVIARLPSKEGLKAIKIAKKLNKPYVIEMVGDIFSALWYHGSALRKLYAPIAYIIEKRVVKKAPYIIYVTEKFLQNRYPSKALRVTNSCSNVELNPNIIKNLKDKTDSDTFIIGLIGSYSSKYKGIDNALKVVKKMIDNNINVELRILGTGNSEGIIKLSKELKIADKVKLDGSLPAGTAVFNWINQLDCYIQPSLTEGLPRALLEAMYLEKPCIASNVGGIPELLSDSVLHTPKNENEMYNKIMIIYTDHAFRKKQSERNGIRAKDFTKNILDVKREKFWNEVVEDLYGGKNK